MYAKVFNSMFEGSLRGRSDAILVFVNLLASANRFGEADRHFRAIADETGLPLERVKTAIDELSAPDAESRSRELEGRRIELLDPERAWGWRIVNYMHYRSIRDEETRREQNREAQARFKRQQVSQGKPRVSNGKQDCLDKPKSAHAEAEGEADAEGDKDIGAKESRPTSKVSFPNGLTDSEWLARLSADPTYAGIDVLREHGKMLNWCRVNNKTATRRRFTNWLNNADRPLLAANGSTPAPKGVNQW